MTDPRINHVRFTIEARDGSGKTIEGHMRRFDVVFPVRDQENIYAAVRSNSEEFYREVIGEV